MAKAPIKYSDLILQDESIQNLINKLTELDQVYANLADDVKAKAKAMYNAINQVTSAQEGGRQAIRGASTDAEKLTKLEINFNNLRTTTQHKIVQVNTAIKEQNRITQLAVKHNRSALGSYDQLSAKYSILKIRLNAMSEAMRKNTKEGREMEAEARKLYERMKELQSATGKNTLNVGNYSSALSGAVSMLGKMTIGVTTIAGAVKMGVDAFEEGIKTAQDFNKEMSILSAITAEPREELKGLEAQARKLGATTIYTASEVVQLQTELAKLGYNKTEIEEMTEGVLAFAQATGASLADASAFAGATLRMFGASAEEAQRYVDVLAKATTTSALNFGYLEVAMSTVGPVANAMGFKLEDTLALLGQLANAGFSASIGATALRNILLHLAGDEDLSKILGGPVHNAEELSKRLDALKEAGIDLSEAFYLTDKRSVSAFNQLINVGEGARRMKEELENANGSAQEMAKTMADNLWGDTKALTSAWEDLMIELNGGQSVLREIVQIFTSLTRGISSAIKAVKDFFKESTTACVALKAEIMGILSTFNSAIPIVGQIYNLAKAIKNHVMGKDNEAKATENANKRIVKSEKQTTNEYSKEIKERLEQYRKEQEAKKNKGAEKEATDALKEQEKQYQADLKARRDYEDSLIRQTQNRELREREQARVKIERMEEDAKHQLELDQRLSHLTIEGRKALNEAITAYQNEAFAKERELNEKYTLADLEAQKTAIDLELKAQKEGTDKWLELSIQKLEMEKQIALQKNKTATRQQDEQTIINSFVPSINALKDRYNKIKLEHFDLEQDLAQSEIDLLEISEDTKTKLRLKLERERLQKILELNRTAGTKLTQVEVDTINNTIAKINKEIGLTGQKDIFGILGLDLTEERKQAIGESFEYVKGAIDSYMETLTHEAEVAVELANQQVESRKSQLEKEQEARANGYASNVALAQKELAEAKRNQDKALKQQADAQKMQLALDAVTQMSDLVTASAGIWKNFPNPLLAIPMISLMWGSFAFSKIKAMQMTRQETYGEGTIELLQGGSHASGNDIDLGRKKDGTRRRAEGGEFFAVINRRNSRKFKSVIPDVINSLNNGTFADKYMSAYDSNPLAINVENSADLGELNDNVRAIKEQGQFSHYSNGGATIKRYKNLTQRVR